MTPPLVSELYETCNHGDYLNFVFEFQTDLNPVGLYKEISKIEDYFGHDRSRRWLPRAVDLDLLFWANNSNPNGTFEPESAMIFFEHKGGVEIPHCEIWNRDFLLKMIRIDLGIDVDLIKLRMSQLSDFD